MNTNLFEDKVILVTGAAGSIGRELVRQLLKLKPMVVRALDTNETGLFLLEQMLDSDRFRAFIGDIRDSKRLNIALENVDIVFHSAALKHVPLCEYNPFEPVKTNIIGTQNLIQIARAHQVKKFITISTDNRTASRLIWELVVFLSILNLRLREKRIPFSITSSIKAKITLF